jgi:hypothetical protein
MVSAEDPYDRNLVALGTNVYAAKISDSCRSLIDVN